MKKKSVIWLATGMLTAAMMAGCTAEGPKEEVQEVAVEETSEVDQEATLEDVEDVASADDGIAKCELMDGVYEAIFETDSSMFHINEAYGNIGSLVVTDGAMTIHITLPSKNILNLYCGLAADAEGDESNWLEPTVDQVTYEDGMTEEVHGFDVPVPALDEEFDLALIGTKGKWYDHKVVVSLADIEESQNEDTQKKLLAGNYSIAFDFEGGSGKAWIESPAVVKVDGEQMIAVLTWSSPNYDYMIVGDEKYLPVNTEGNSVFEIPVASFDEPLNVIGDTVAMSKPHEIEYVLTFHVDTMEEIHE